MVQRCGLNSSGSGEDPLVGACENGNETLVFIKGRKFNQLSNYQLVKKDYALWSQLIITLLDERH
jgi:hypothetical protein